MAVPSRLLGFLLMQRYQPSFAGYCNAGYKAVADARLAEHNLTRSQTYAISGVSQRLSFTPMPFSTAFL